VLLSGRFHAALLLRSGLSGALTYRMRCVGQLRKRSLVSVSVPLLMLSFLTGLAKNLRVRVRAFPLLFSATMPGFRSRRLPSRLTIRSSRPHVVASVMCFTLRLHMSAAPPQGGLTQALGTTGECVKLTCYMCDSPATSQEHAPPASLFPELSTFGKDLRKNLITVEPPREPRRPFGLSHAACFCSAAFA
jgi:hypothetical protein